MSGEIFPLSDTQQQAVEPRDSVWLSASAGTGKTQVLSARVLRLLLESGTQPSELLCLTFTKAGAAEMATRVNEVLARWVRMSDTDLASDLRKIGAPHGRETLERARTLFASVLDCPGGGLRIDTIHAFAQWLLSAFPEEAGLLPGTRAMEDRDRDLLAHDVLAALLVDLQRDGEKALLDTLAELSVTHGPDGARSWLMRCADAREMWFGTGAWQGPLEERVKQLLGLPSDADEAWLSTYCLSPEFDQPALEQCLAHYGDWKSSSSKTALDVIPRWLAQDAANRLAMLPALSEALFYKNGNGKLP
ncbi:MAG: UvrD-helicase domain-containing protein, partial [Sphingomonadaceae bacterium]|nr:UvrD-helicase domain-containing protein [Sphingomonadaceae bacterium]